MQGTRPIGIVFLALAFFFLSLSISRYFSMGRKASISQKIWFQIAFIFALAGLALYFLQVWLK
ncbi:MAG: hypothetical protein AB1611_20265 [bacterium]